RVSVDSNGTQGDGDSGDYNPSISGDGRYVAFESAATNLVPGDTNGAEDVFIHDTQTGTTTRVSVDSEGTEGDGDSCELSISADGRYVAFESRATNLVAFDYNETWDVFRVLNK
ncbi:MAG: PD40 domain-containing protein, partial [Spirochaetota bacterium]